jgi:hypothetical protein
MAVDNIIIIIIIINDNNIDDMNIIHVALDTVQCQALANTKLKFEVPYWPQNS